MKCFLKDINKWIAEEREKERKSDSVCSKERNDDMSLSFFSQSCYTFRLLSLHILKERKKNHIKKERKIVEIKYS